MTASAKILPVMLALAGGKTFDTIIYETALRLQKRYPKMYEAWGVITTFGRWNLPIPNSLLEAILGDPHFGYEMRNNPNRRGSKGLIFPSSCPFNEGWFPGHQLIGQAAFDRVYCGRLKEYCEKAVLQGKPDDAEHCIFLARMFRNLSSPKVGDTELARKLFEENEKVILRFSDSSPESGVDWGFTLRAMERKDLAKQYLISAEPATARGALMRSSLLDRMGEFTKALQAAEDWCRSHPNDTLVRGYHLSLVARGSKVEVTKALQTTREWLDASEHQNDTYVHGCYLGLVQARGSNDEASAAIKLTREWLAASEHQNDTNVRGCYLGLVQARGSNDEASAAIKLTREWLAAPEHQNDTFTRGAYLGLLEERGEGQTVRDAIQDTRAWLGGHITDTQVRACYLALVNEKGSGGDAKQAITSTEEWLGCPDPDTTGSVRAAYVRLVEKHLPGQLDPVIAETRRWVNDNREAVEAWAALITLLVRLRKFPEASDVAQAAAAANPEDIQILQRYLDRCRKGMPKEHLCATIDKILSGSQTDTRAQLKCADWLSEAQYYDRAQELFDKAEAKVKGWYQFHYAYGWHLHRQEKYAEAIEQFRKVLAKQPQHQLAHDGLGRALRDLAKRAEQFGDAQTAKQYRKEAEDHFKSAINRSQTLKMPTARFHTARGWLYYDWGRFDEALADFTAANRDEYHFMNGLGQGAALVALKRYPEALAALRKALELAPQPLEPPASDEIRRLISECENALNNPTLKS